MHRLVTIRFSHYNEKARWALDRFEIPYEEEGYMPGMHPLGVLPLAPRFGLGTSNRIATPLATPVLVTDEGTCIRESSRIVRWASDRFGNAETSLYPDAEVEELEKRFSERLGPHTRRFGYFTAFGAPELLEQVAEGNVGPVQARWFIRLYPLIQRFIAGRLGVTDERAARSRVVIAEEMEDVSRRIEGRRFLVGDRFTAADLAFACMIAPTLLPSPEEGYGAFFPPLDLCPPEFETFAREMRTTPAGVFALRLFREERGKRRVPFRASA